MKRNRCFIKGMAAALLLATSAFVAKGVDGLRLQIVQATNVTLRWPSIPGQTYVIAQTTNLNDPIQWSVLESGEIPRSRSEFYIQFIFYWQLVGDTYQNAVRHAQDLVRAAYPTPVMHYVDGPRNGQGYWPGNDQARVGYEEMQFNRYNKHYDIPRP